MKGVGVLGRERLDCLPLFWKMGPRSFLERGGGTRSSDPRELWKSGLLIGSSLDLEIGSTDRREGGGAI